MLMVAHQMAFAWAIPDRDCFFCEGRITEQRSPEQIFDDTHNPRTKQFRSALREAGRGDRPK